MFACAFVLWTLFRIRYKRPATFRDGTKIKAISKRKWWDREGGSRSSPWDMSCPRKLFLDERKSSETSACRPTSVRCLKENKCSSAFHVRRHFLFSLRTWERGKTACGRLGRQNSARTKTSARLKITFVDMTYPGQGPELPSLYPHFLLLSVISDLNPSIARSGTALIKTSTFFLDNDFALREFIDSF